MNIEQQTVNAEHSEVRATDKRHMARLDTLFGLVLLMWLRTGMD